MRKRRPFSKLTRPEALAVAEGLELLIDKLLSQDVAVVSLREIYQLKREAEETVKAIPYSDQLHVHVKVNEEAE